MRQLAREAFAAMTAKRCNICQKRMKRYRESPYLHYYWRCTGCGRIIDVDLDPVKQMEFK